MPEVIQIPGGGTMVLDRTPADVGNGQIAQNRFAGFVPPKPEAQQFQEYIVNKFGNMPYEQTKGAVEAAMRFQAIRQFQTDMANGKSAYEAMLRAAPLMRSDLVNVAGTVNAYSRSVPPELVDMGQGYKAMYNPQRTELVQAPVQFTNVPGSQSAPGAPQAQIWTSGKHGGQVRNPYTAPQSTKLDEASKAQLDILKADVINLSKAEANARLLDKEDKIKNIQAEREALMNKIAAFGKGPAVTAPAPKIDTEVPKVETKVEAPIAQPQKDSIQEYVLDTMFGIVPAGKKKKAPPADPRGEQATDDEDPLGLFK